MSPIKRRHFIQSAGATLATIGLSQVDFWQQAQQFDRVNAQTASRKFALLVDINAYSGCHSNPVNQNATAETGYEFRRTDQKQRGAESLRGNAGHL